MVNWIEILFTVIEKQRHKTFPKPKNKTDSSPQKAIVLEELLNKSQNDYCITKPKSPLHTTPKGHCKKRQKRYLHTRPKWPLHTRRKWSSHTKPKWPCITKMTIAYHIKMTIAYQKKWPLHTKPKWQLYKMYSINDKKKFYVYFFVFIIEIDPFISLFFLQTDRLYRVKCFSFMYNFKILGNWFHRFSTPLKVTLGTLVWPKHCFIKKEVHPIQGRTYFQGSKMKCINCSIIVSMQKIVAINMLSNV